ncbi:MAG: ArsR family transcriptional regulator [Calditrichaeota bacterium]|nr:MAG: ArsR family transcriptional regulator [Calditrichota bacterium]
MESILSIELLQRAAEILKAIAHPIRLQIIQALEGGEKCVSELQTILSQPQAVTSQHLNVLRLRGLLKSRRDGTLVYYSISEPFVLRILNCMRECIISKNN